MLGLVFFRFVFFRLVGFFMGDALVAFDAGLALGLLEHADPGLEVGRGLEILADPGLAQSLQQQPDGAVREAEHLEDDRHRSYLVQVLGLGLVAAVIRNHEYDCGPQIGKVLAEAVTVPIIGIGAGYSQGREYAELPWSVDLMIVVLFVLVIFNILMTIRQRRESILYVSIWYIAAAVVLMLISFIPYGRWVFFLVLFGPGVPSVVAGEMAFGLAAGSIYYAALYGDWRLLFDRSGLVFYGALLLGAAAGLLVTFRQGNQQHYRANTESPVYQELLSIVRKTFGVADVIREALEPLDSSIQLAFVYGSMAKARGIGYTSSELGFDGESCAAMTALGVQSPDISQGVDRTRPEDQGAGDQVCQRKDVQLDRDHAEKGAGAVDRQAPGIEPGLPAGPLRRRSRLGCLSGHTSTSSSPVCSRL